MVQTKKRRYGEQLASMALDTTGRLWLTKVLPGKLGMFDPTIGTLTELPVSTVSGAPAALYEPVIDHQDAIWFVDVGADMLVRYAPGKQTMTFLRLSVPGNVPFDLTLDPVNPAMRTRRGRGGLPASGFVRRHERLLHETASFRSVLSNSALKAGPACSSGKMIRAPG